MFWFVEGKTVDGLTYYPKLEKRNRNWYKAVKEK